MSNDTTNTAKSSAVVVKPISDDMETRLSDIGRQLHHTTLLALTECGIKPTFSDKYETCGAEDLKNLHQQFRALLSEKKRIRRENRVAGIRAAIQGVVDTYMVAARKAKEQFDALPAEVRQFVAAFPATVKIPLSDIRACFPQGASDKEVFADLDYMSYKVTEMTTKGVVIVPFVPATDTSGIKAA